MEGPQFFLFVILQTKSEVVKFEGPKLNLHLLSDENYNFPKKWWWKMMVEVWYHRRGGTINKNKGPFLLWVRAQS